MADEITIAISFNIVNGNFRLPIATGSLSFDQTTSGGGNPGSVDIGTSEEDISFGDITTLGWLYMRNLDDTNYVTWGPKSGTMVACGRMEAGEPACFRMEPGITMTMQANTASCRVYIAALDD